MSAELNARLNLVNLKLNHATKTIIDHTIGIEKYIDEIREKTNDKTILDKLESIEYLTQFMCSFMSGL